jgi:hypothetical protein
VRTCQKKKKKTHNNGEESYLVPEELVLHIVISLSCLIIFFDFTTKIDMGWYKVLIKIRKSSN